MSAAAIKRKAAAVRTRQLGWLRAPRLFRDRDQWLWLFAPPLTVNRFLKVLERSPFGSVKDIRDTVGHRVHAGACSDRKAIGKNRRISGDLLRVNLVPDREDDCSAGGRLPLGESIELPLRPFLREEVSTEDNDAEPAGLQTLVDLASETIAHMQYKLVEPDLETAKLERVRERANEPLVLCCMTDEDVTLHAVSRLPKRFRQIRSATTLWQRTGESASPLRSDSDRNDITQTAARSRARIRERTGRPWWLSLADTT